MATMEDLQDVLTSVDESMREQTTLLQDILGIQKSIFESQKRAEEKNKVSRTEAEPRSDTSGAPDRGTGGNDSSDNVNESGQNKIRNMIASVFAGTFFGNAFSGTIASISKVLKVFKLVFRNLKAGGILGLAIYGIYEVFKDIGDNPEFKIALETIRTIWNDNIIPTFNRIKEAVSNLMETESVQSAITGIRDWFENLRINIQDFVGETLQSIALSIGSVFEGINQLLDGDFVGGIWTILKGVITSITNIFDSAITNFLEIFGANFGENGSFLSFVTTKWNETMASVTEFWNGMIENIKIGFREFANFFDPLVESVDAAIKWSQTLFSDPTEALSQLWSGLYGEGGIVDMIWYPVNLAIDWITKKLGWREEDAPTFSMMGFFGDVFNTIKEKFIAFGDYVSGIPDRIALEAKGMWIDLKEKLKLGFLDLAEWLASIPNKMLAMVMNLLDAVQFTVPDWVPRIGGNVLRLIDQESVDAANAVANEVNPSFERQRQEIFATASGERGRLANEIERLEASALAGNTTTVVMAPNNSQTNISSTGGTASSTTVVAGGSRSDLDTLGHRGAQ